MARVPDEPELLSGENVSLPQPGNASAIAFEG